MKILIAYTLLFIFSFSVNAQDQYEFVDVVAMQHQPIVKGTLNGKKAYFLLDTGSDVTLINKSDAKRFGFLYRDRYDLREYKLSGLGKSSTELLGIYDLELQLGSQKIKDIFLAYDITNIVNSLHAGHALHINGIIGSKALRRYGFVIDYDLKEVKMKVR